MHLRDRLVPHLRSPRNLSIRRIDDERGSVGTDDVTSAAAEDRIVRAWIASSRGDGCRTAGRVILSIEQFLLLGRRLLLGHELPAAVLIRPFQRDLDIPAAPDTLQVGIAPRGASRVSLTNLHRAARGRRTVLRLAGNVLPGYRCNDEGRRHRDRRQGSLTHRKLLFTTKRASDRACERDPRLD